MALSKTQIFLYAATDADYNNSLKVASTFGLPVGHVLGSFAHAWTAAASGKLLAIAVGTPANNSLFYNPCGYGNLGVGGTPFINDDTPRDTLPPVDTYMNAAGETVTDSADLAYNYVYYALNGNCSGCYSVSPVAPSETCNGRNPGSPYSAHFGDQVAADGSPCPTGNACRYAYTSTPCTGGSCPALSTIESDANDAGWDPEGIAESVLALFSRLGVDTGGMDKYMAVAAMEGQGCYNCPCSCTGYESSCDCSSPATGEGFGVLQETWTGSALYHAQTALNEVSGHGQSTTVWFPKGITPCTVVADPGAAFAEFYWWAFSVPKNNCGTVGEWVGSPCSLACCAIKEYTAQTGITCSISTSTCSCSA